MAKKIVRGITDVKTINNQDFDTNNVNDLLSDGQYNYIHRKKGKTEEYHNLTDNIKTISSDNTDLLAVTNNNKTTNTATLHPKHDAQKEQVLESTRNTITINHGENGTAEKTSVDVNFDKVQQKLTAGTGITIQGHTISASVGVQGASVSIQDLSNHDDNFIAVKHVVTIEQKILTTFSFECYTETAEIELTGEIKEELSKFIGQGYSVSNGALSISHELDVMKLLNHTAEYHNNQQATFTFFTINESGGEGGGGGGGTIGS